MIRVLSDQKIALKPCAWLIVEGDRMDNQSELQTNDTNNVWGFLGGMLVGSLAGAVAMLLFAPQSGKRTRAKIQQKSIELREQTTDAVEDALAQTRHKARQISSSVRDQAEAIQQRGQDVLDEQKGRLSTLVETGKTAVQGVLS
jgi:gas vesicle protein